MTDGHRASDRDGVSPFLPIQRRSRSDDVRKQLEAAVEHGDYKPGDRLPSERELSQMFGVSRVSVRDAVRSLEALGIVDVRHGSGSYVARPRTDAFAGPFGKWIELHRDEVLELLAVRTALDQLAAQRAAERASRGALEEVSSAYRAFARRVDSGPPDLDQLSDLDIAFHEAVARASESDLIVRLLTDLNRQLEESRRAALAAPSRRAQSVREHAEIVAAISSGDPPAARDAVACHVESVITFLENIEGGHAST